MKRKIVLLAATVALAFTAGVANAATYTVTGSGSTSLPNGGFLAGVIPLPAGTVIATTSVTGTGTVDDTGGVFNSAFFTLTTTGTSPLSPDVDFDLVSTTAIDALGNLTTTIVSCTDNGAAAACDQAPTVGSITTEPAATFDFSDLSALTWESSVFVDLPDTPPVPAPQIWGDSLTQLSYTATPAVVPLPAAAWLFGSGLIGLAGIARRKRG